MEPATLTRRSSDRQVPSPANPARRRRPSVPSLALIALSLGTLVGFVVYPTFPNYDSYYSLLWGREVLDAGAPSFDAYRAPTEHPLAVALGAILSLIGDSADRVLVGLTLVSFVVLVAGMYRLGKAAFTPWIGLVAGALLCTRFDFPFLAARGYIDIPYLAFIVWAAALETERPRRGVPVLVLLVLAGLMRPEAWLLAALYWCWIAWPADWPTRFKTAAIASIGPVTWVLVDFAATGEPLFSLTHTSGLAEELGRQRELADVPSASVEFLKSLDKVPVFYAGILGGLLAAYLTPRRLVMPLTLLGVGLGTFVLVGLAGLSVIDRYLLVPSLMVMILAAVALAGFTMLEPGRVRTTWAGAAGALLVYGVVFTVTHVNLNVFENNLTFRGEAHASLERLLADPAVEAGRRCGPVSVPNHKLIPDTRWILDAGVQDVLARSDPDARAETQAGGVAIYITDRNALLRQALVETGDEALDSIPMAGFERVANTGYYGAYVKC